MVAELILPPAASVFGSILGWSSSKDYNDAVEKAAEINTDYQREFAQSGIQWRVQDAKKAGISPLAALGSSGASYTPVQRVGGPFDWQSAGQDLSTSISRGFDLHAKKKLIIAQVRKETAEAGVQELNLQILRKKLRDMNATKPIPQPGMGIVHQNQGGGDLYTRQPVPTSSAPGVQEGMVPEGQYNVSRTGFLKYYPNQNIMDLLSESLPAALGWWDDMRRYKWAMEKGRRTPGSDLNRWYKAEKARIEKEIGRKIYWHNTLRWRLESYRQKNETKDFWEKLENIFTVKDKTKSKKYQDPFKSRIDYWKKYKKY